VTMPANGNAAPPAITCSSSSMVRGCPLSHP
jgi:hypothetical protein